MKLETLDNPGWTVEIDLYETSLDAEPFVDVKLNYGHETDWQFVQKKIEASKQLVGLYVCQTHSEFFWTGHND